MSSLNQVEKHQYIFFFLQMEMDQFLIYGIVLTWFIIQSILYMP